MAEVVGDLPQFLDRLVSPRHLGEGEGLLGIVDAACATWHTNDMAQRNYFSHTDSIGRDPFKRMTAFGYGYSTSRGENIAAGNATAAGTIAQWKASTGHNRNMLSSVYKVIGISRSYSATSPYKWYWNTDFGGYVDASVPCPS